MWKLWRSERLALFELLLTNDGIEILIYDKLEYSLVLLALLFMVLFLLFF